MKRVVMMSVSIAIVATAGAVVYLNTARHPSTELETTPRSATVEVHEPTLYCDFYNFMHNATVVSFYFSANLATPTAPRFSELYMIEPDGTKTSFDGAPATRPDWMFTTDDGTPTITSPDTAIRILLYGYRPKASGIVWTEAGIRSDTYKISMENAGRPISVPHRARVDRIHRDPA